MAIQLIHCILCHDYVNSFKTLAAMHLELAFSRTDSSILFYTCKGSSKVHHAPCVYNQPLTQAQRLFDCVDSYGASCPRNSAFCRSGCRELSNSIDSQIANSQQFVSDFKKSNLPQCCTTTHQKMSYTTDVILCLITP